MIFVNTISDYHRYLIKYRDLIDTTIDMNLESKTYFKKQWSVEKLKDQKDNWIFLEAVDEKDIIIGILMGTPLEGGVGTIIWVLVDNNYQKKGIGRDLFQNAINLYKLKGGHKVKLTVPDEKTTDFYKKNGMRVEGFHSNHWWKQDFWALGIDI